MVVVHKARGKSIYNKLHGNIRIMKDTDPDADVIVTAHTHQPAMLITHEYSKPKILIKTGTYKGSDNYSWKFWPDITGQTFFPIVAFRKDQFEMKPFVSIQDFTNFMKSQKIKSA